MHNLKVINIKYQAIKFNKRPTVQSHILIISYSIESASHPYIISKTYRIVKLFNHPLGTCLFFTEIYLKFNTYSYLYSSQFTNFGKKC